MPPDLWAVLKVTPHPVMPFPAETVLRSEPLGQLLDLLDEREKEIERMAVDPHRYGYEPFVWKILDAFCGFPWADPSPADIAGERDPETRAKLSAKAAWCLKVRRTLLHQDNAIRVLLLNGGNRAGKSEWCASRVTRLLVWKQSARAWCFHTDERMSIEYQQPVVFKYLPKEMKTTKSIREKVANVMFTVKNGFSEKRFVLPNASDCSFRYYQQDDVAVQGGEVDIAWCSELVPATWVQELKARVATRNGWLLIDFTPVKGYSPTVKMFLDVATATREATAFALPEDGQPPLPELAMLGDDSRRWLEPGATSQPPVPAGRRFARVPRVMKMPDRMSAVAFFHSWENAFGNPLQLWALHSGESADYRKMKFYGLATKAARNQFDFDPAIHVIPDSAVPKEGTWYHVVDPCAGRNFAMIWAIVSRSPAGDIITIAKEWPCPGMYVPGVGDMGEWAITGDKHDGARGPAQDSLCWGQSRYKAEILRLEGRPDWERAAEEEDKPFQWDADDEPEHVPAKVRSARLARAGGIEPYERIMDSRFAAAPTQTRSGQTTLLEEFAEIGLEFVPASGKDIDEGTPLVNDLLRPRNFDPEQPRSTLNTPRLLVAASCRNTIFALQNWTGMDGQHGACKDFADLLRYLVLAEPEDRERRAA